MFCTLYIRFLTYFVMWAPKRQNFLHRQLYSTNVLLADPQNPITEVLKGTVLRFYHLCHTKAIFILRASIKPGTEKFVSKTG